MSALATPMPAAARGRGGRDTLFSAAWFEEADTGTIPFAGESQVGAHRELDAAPARRGPSLLWVVLAAVVGLGTFAVGMLSLVVALIATFVF